MARYIRLGVDELREILGLPRRTGQNSFQKGAGDGAAIRNVQTTSVMATFDQAIKDAFSVGVDPPKVTAENTSEMRITLDDIRSLLKNGMDKLPAAIGDAVATRIGDVLKSAMPLNPAVNGGSGLGIGADIARKMITG